MNGIIAVTLSLGLAACGGGGGGSVPSSGGSGGTGGSGNTVTPLTHSQQKATMQSSLSAVQTLTATSTGLSLGRHALAIHKGSRHIAAAVCSDGQTSVDTSDGTNETETDSTYYDAGCTELEEVDVVTVPLNATGTSFTATGTVTDYSLAGAVTAYETLNLSFNEPNSTQATITIQASQAGSVGGPITGQVGETCNLNESGSTETIACGSAEVVTSSGTQTGASILENGSSTSTSETLSLTAAAYSAASGLAISQGGSPAWNVTGAAPIDTVSGSITETSGGLTIALSDSATGVSISGSVSGSTLTITESQSGKTLATATVNSSGNGTITYADGTSAAIVDWTVQG